MMKETPYESAKAPTGESKARIRGIFFMVGAWAGFVSGKGISGFFDAARPAREGCKQKPSQTR
ncbi:MAG TPA: hypothetical protein PLL19_00710 [Thiobacillaceae bacterium]|nr:hypothetical protein [Thiobacillaceae bacterium]HNF87818.1 hypothetical protein [Thiobacillaceae bacterium]